jgi:hypothetical protein
MPLSSAWVSGISRIDRRHGISKPVRGAERRPQARVSAAPEVDWLFIHFEANGIEELSRLQLTYDPGKAMEPQGFFRLRVDLPN